MRVVLLRIIAGVMLAAAATLAVADDDAATQPAPSPATMPAATTQSSDVWQQLGSTDFSEREAATDVIWAMGEPARARLMVEAAAGTVDKQERCRRVLWLLDLGITPGMPPAVLNAVTGYDYAAPVAERMQRVQAMQPAARAGSPVLLKLGLQETDPQMQRIMFTYSAPAAVLGYVNSLISAVPPDLAAIDAYARAYEKVAPDPSPRTLRLCLLELGGTRDKEIDAIKATNLSRSMIERRRLAQLLCAAGRDREAIDVTRTQPAYSPLLRALLIRSGDWAGLRRSFDEAPMREAIDAPAAAACQRLVGDLDGANERMRSWLSQQNTRTEQSRRSVAGRLMLNDMTAEAAAIWTGLPDSIDVFRLLGRWPEAVALAKSTPPPGALLVGVETSVWQRDCDRMLAEIGEKPATRIDPSPVVEPWRADWKSAADAYLKKNFTAAVAASDRVLAIAKDEAAAYRLKAICLAKLGQKEPAAAASQIADLRCHGLYTTWLQAIERFDSVGLIELGDIEADRLVRAQPDWPPAIIGVFERNARQAARKKNWPAAARAADQMVMTALITPIAQLRAPGYVLAPYESHLYHARAAWEAGDKPAAILHMNAANALLPVEGSIPIEFVPKLTAAGETKAANALFDSAWSKMTDLCEKFPKAAHLRNSTAWMALRCDRHMDDALKLAQECVTLRPGEAGSMDTLAEAQFRNGMKDEAIATMRAAIQLSPEKAMLKDRLAGFEAGKVVVPTEE